MGSPRSGSDLPHELIDAIVAVGSESSLDAVLRLIVKAATDLVDAEYGALGVLAGPGSEVLGEFITVGMAPDQIDSVGQLPTGRGVLGLLIREPHPLRMHDLTASSSSYGFPPGHPPMRSFLGVPIRVREEVFGNLYLTEKRGGDFSEDDERILIALAAAAGMAISNARLHEAGMLRERWLEAAADMTTEILALPAQRSPVDIITTHLHQIAPAAQIITTARDDAGESRVTSVRGGRADALLGLRVPDTSSLAEAVSDALNDASVRVVTADLVRDRSPEATVAMVVTGENAVAVIEPLASLLSRFALQATLAMGVADSRSVAEQVALSEDRDRIARDLHDLVIQRLFASGMALESSVRLIDSDVATERIHRVVDELDTTIREIRTAIYALQSPPDSVEPQGLRSKVLSIVQASTETLGSTPSIQFEGPVDSVVPSRVATNVEAVLIEALSNVSRHAHAQRVQVSLVAAAGELTVTVTDDGVGIPAAARRSGLSNLAARAHELGGSFHTSRPEAGGARVTWTVPLSD